MTEAAPSIEKLIGDLSATDFNVRARALAELVRRGHEATSALVQTLDSTDDEVRVRAVRGLAEIADASCADLFARLLDDADERIRAHAAFGLARLRDSRALNALVRTIDDFEDVLRTPETLSTDGLVEFGAAALPSVAPLLSAPHPMTRARAFSVIQRIVSELLDMGDWPARWRELGSYDPMSEGPERERAAEQWRNWIARHVPGGEQAP